MLTADVTAVFIYSCLYRAHCMSYQPVSVLWTRKSSCFRLARCSIAL